MACVAVSVIWFLAYEFIAVTRLYGKGAAQVVLHASTVVFGTSVAAASFPSDLASQKRFTLLPSGVTALSVLAATTLTQERQLRGPKLQGQVVDDPPGLGLPRQPHSCNARAAQRTHPRATGDPARQRPGAAGPGASKPVRPCLGPHSARVGTLLCAGRSAGTQPWPRGTTPSVAAMAPWHNTIRRRPFCVSRGGHPLAKRGSAVLCSCACVLGQVRAGVDDGDGHAGHCPQHGGRRPHPTPRQATRWSSVR